MKTYIVNEIEEPTADSVAALETTVASYIVKAKDRQSAIKRAVDIITKNKVVRYENCTYSYNAILMDQGRCHVETRYEHVVVPVAKD